MHEEFDEQTVIDLVEKALAEGETLQPKSTIPLAYAQGSTYELLFEKLSPMLHPADLQMLLDDLRSELFSGINIGDLKTLHLITKNCRKCPSAVPDPHLPKWNVADPDCVIVCETPIQDGDSAQLLVQSLVQAGFSSSRVTLTYLNRCQNKNKDRYSLDEIKNCLAFLHTELQLLRPKLIVTLGLLPTTSVLGIDVKLGDVRGDITWLGPWAIMATYSPAYVLRGSSSYKSVFQQDLQNAYDFTYGAK